MTSFKPLDLRQQAGDVLQRTAQDPKKLVLIHTSAALGVSLLITALSFFLNQQIAETGGLSGLGLRSLLSTVQSVLEFAATIALPFWEIGLLFAVLCWTKGEPVETKGLLQGFRRIGPVVALRLIQGALYLFLGMGILYICSIGFVMTPLAEPLRALLEPMSHAAVTQQDIEAFMTAEMMVAMADAIKPLILLFGGIYLLAALPLFYRLRFAEFAVMDGAGAMGAIAQSLRMTRKNTWKLVCLDLSFWWYYVLYGLCMVLCYGDMLLPMAGITLAVSEDVGFFLFYLLGTLCQWLLLWQFRGKVLTTYGMAYKTLWVRPPTPREQNLP